MTPSTHKRLELLFLWSVIFFEVTFFSWFFAKVSIGIMFLSIGIKVASIYFVFRGSSKTLKITAALVLLGILLRTTLLGLLEASGIYSVYTVLNTFLDLALLGLAARSIQILWSQGASESLVRANLLSPWIFWPLVGLGFALSCAVYILAPLGHCRWSSPSQLCHFWGSFAGIIYLVAPALFVTLIAIGNRFLAKISVALFLVFAILEFFLLSTV